MSELLNTALRRVVPTASEAFKPYERYGKAIPGLEWLPLSGHHAQRRLRVFLDPHETGRRF